MKTTVTLTIDRELLRRALRVAERRGVPLDRLISERLESLVAPRRSYAAARRRALARLEKGYDLGWVRPSSRDELYER